MPTSALTLIRGRADVGIGPYDHTNPDLMSLYESIHTKERPAAEQVRCRENRIWRAVGGGVPDAPNVTFPDSCGPSRTPAPTN